MKIADILRYKGADVATIMPNEPVLSLVHSLAKRKIGALVVLDEGTVVGVASERDVVRHLAEFGADALHMPVAQIMSAEVVSCASDAPVDDVAAEMTNRRVRHMPVVDGGTLAGIVSIGDIVSSQIRQLEHDRGQLEHYISG